MIDYHNLVQRVVNAPKPLPTLYEILISEIWSPANFMQAQQQSTIASYLHQGERHASRLEYELYQKYSDLYRLLEHPESRHDRVMTLHAQAPYTLLVISGLSLREIPPIQAKLTAYSMDPQPDFALILPPSETGYFVRRHYGLGHPSEIMHRAGFSFAFRYVVEETWQLDFPPKAHQRYLWYALPSEHFDALDNAHDDVLKDIFYEHDVIQVIITLLEKVLADPTLVRPLVITSDHGYLWQGPQCGWPLTPGEAMLMARTFGTRRSSTMAFHVLAKTRKAWIRNKIAAARGRFEWRDSQPIAHRNRSPFVYGGVSLMECIVPWIVCP